MPRELQEFLAEPNPAVIAVVGPDGSPVSVATWYDWVGGRVFVNMDAARRRLAYLKSDPRVAVTVLHPEKWSHVSLRGSVSQFVDDEQLRDIDALSVRYTGQPFEERGRPRVSAWIDVETWHSWGVDD